MSTTTGRRAEQAAAEYLENLGMSIVAMNWRNRYCEIDVIASLRRRSGFRFVKKIYFVEVKYRSQMFQGDGLDYITTSKKAQLLRAAQFWVSDNKWAGDYEVLAVAVSGHEFVVTDVATIQF